MLKTYWSVGWIGWVELIRPWLGLGLRVGGKGLKYQTKVMDKDTIMVKSWLLAHED